jgi:adenosylcobinamide-phosphate synthase
MGILLGVSSAISWILLILPLSPFIEIAVGCILLAQRSLIDHIQAVINTLTDHGVVAARATVSTVVGRDTETMDESHISRAAIEACAEGFLDGFIAPAFWLIVGGLPGIIIYKMINTADSMIGHLNEKYKEFGWAAAKIDDLANYLPARLAFFFIALSGGSLFTSTRHAIKESRLQPSPNAGWPEWAMAASLHIKLSGPRSYESYVVNAPWINEFGRENINRDDITEAILIIRRAWFLFLCHIVVFAIVLSLL